MPEVNQQPWQSDMPNSFKESLTKLMQAGQNPLARCYARKLGVFSWEYLNDLKSAIISSSYLDASQLSDNFTNTRGFSVVFKRSGISEVIKEFPYFQPYLQVALKSACNAFYLNPLILESGGHVTSHVDCSLSAYGKVWTIPNLVSVLYVYVPEDLQGGELVLESSEPLAAALRYQKIAEIPPQFNTLLYFMGNLLHSVNPVQSSKPRISLICEQYTLEPNRLESIPEFEILSGANIKRY
jgi:Rps23 Pro-64 3,4-dihydroxylase Tpa1-like proline 4-hydroxylase